MHDRAETGARQLKFLPPSKINYGKQHCHNSIKKWMPEHMQSSFVHCMSTLESILGHEHDIPTRSANKALGEKIAKQQSEAECHVMMKIALEMTQD